MEKLVYLENGLLKAKSAFREIKNITTSRDFELSDSNKFLVHSGTSAITLNIPLNIFQIGVEIEILRFSSGNITITSTTGVTLISKNTTPFVTTALGSVMIIKQITLNNWLVAL